MTRATTAVAVFLVVFGVAAACAAFFTFRPPADPPKRVAGSAVKVVVEGVGHGSGVHIGNGYIVTAAHVIGDQTSVTLKTDTGEEVSATVLWTNKTYDLALLITDARPLASSLACEPMAIGTPVRAIGNPINLEFIVTRGYIASDAAKRGVWEASIIVDITIASGVSGGPVFDSRGRVVGIAVGAAAMSSGFFPSPVAYAYVVPASAVCKLLARA